MACLNIDPPSFLKARVPWEMTCPRLENDILEAAVQTWVTWTLSGHQALRKASHICLPLHSHLFMAPLEFLWGNEPYLARNWYFYFFLLWSHLSPATLAGRKEKRCGVLSVQGTGQEKALSLPGKVGTHLSIGAGKAWRKNGTFLGHTRENIVSRLACNFC